MPAWDKGVGGYSTCQVGIRILNKRDKLGAKNLSSWGEKLGLVRCLPVEKKARAAINTFQPGRRRLGCNK